MYRRKIMAAVVLLLGLAMPGIAVAAQAYVTGNVNVRSGPGTGYARIATLPAGARVNVGSCRGNWCQVSRSGLRGWMSANFLDRGYAQRPIIVAPVITGRPHYRPGRPHYRPPHHNRPPHWNRPPRPGGPRPPRPGRPANHCKIAPGFSCR